MILQFKTKCLYRNLVNTYASIFKKDSRDYMIQFSFRLSFFISKDAPYLKLHLITYNYLLHVKSLFYVPYDMLS